MKQKRQKKQKKKKGKFDENVLNVCNNNKKKVNLNNKQIKTS